MTISRREAVTLSSSAIAGLSMAAMTTEATQAQVKTAMPGQKKKWWLDEPVRCALILYNQNQAPVDTDKFVQQLVDLNVNSVYLPTGGIAAYYPTKIPFHMIAPSVPPGRDLIGEIIKKAHARGIYIISRFEFSVLENKDVLTAHPDWLQLDAGGQPKIWYGTYVMCVNGGWLQEQSFKIMGEVMDKYPIDGMFFNGAGQRNTDGLPCYCNNCKRLYHAKYNAEIPPKLDAQYNAFIAECVSALSDKISAFVRAKRPDLNFFSGKDPDSINGETHSAPIVGQRAYWLYGASETVNRIRSTWPERMSFNNDASFLDGFWRYASRNAPDGESRAYQNMANGGVPFIFVCGPFDQYDGNALKGAVPAFKFHKDHEEYYVRQENAARVLLLEPESRGVRGSGGRGGPAGDPAAGNGGFGYKEGGEAGSGGGNADSSMRGFFRILTEQHIPFALSSDLSWIDKDPGKYDLVISYRGAPAALDKYLRQGGRVLVSGATKPDLDVPAVVKLWKRQDTQSAYWKVQDHALFPSLKDTSLVFFYSDYLELEPHGTAALTMMSPSGMEPMEKVHIDMRETNKPGLYIGDYGQGKLAYIPWDIGDLYYRSSAIYHSGIVGDLVDFLLPKGRQIVTNAHPMVQMTVQEQKQRRRTLVHFVNNSGMSESAYHPAIPMNGIQVEVAGGFTSARMLSANRDLPLRKSGGYVSFTLPSLDAYDVVVLT